LVVSGNVSAIVAGLAVGVAGVMVAPVAAQNRDQTVQLGRPQTPRPRSDPARESRYQIGVMERVLEDAVEHGFSNWRDRWQAVLPAQTMLLDNARARGYRLEGYGVFFDVEVPSLETTWFSVFKTLDQNGLGLENALKTVKAHVEASGDANLTQALKRIELEVAPGAVFAAAAAGGVRPVPGPAQLAADTRSQGSVDPIVSDPEEAYRSEVIHAISDALLDHGSPLEIGPDEWLAVGAPSGARRNEVRLRLAPLDSNAHTIIIRVRGGDLNAFRAGQISREEAIKRVDVRVF
jgi:hypothetical protein